jgi:hypothetical protein
MRILVGWIALAGVLAACGKKDESNEQAAAADPKPKPQTAPDAATPATPATPPSVDAAPPIDAAPVPKLSDQAADWVKFKSVEDAQDSFETYFEKTYSGKLYAEANNPGSKVECSWETREAMEDRSPAKWKALVTGGVTFRLTMEGLTVNNKEDVTLTFYPDPAKKGAWVCDAATSVATREALVAPNGNVITPPPQNGCFRIMANCRGRNPTDTELTEALKQGK